jgi:hypothetical protein
MMPRLKVARHTRVGNAGWPDWDERQATALFVGRPQYRKLVVLLDSATLDDVDLAVWSKTWLLAGLLTLDVVECFRYADDGPPADVPRSKDEFFGESVPRWAVLGPDDGTGFRSVRASNGDRVSERALWGDAADVAASDIRTDAYSELAPSEAATRRRADALAASVAYSVGADVFVTRRPYLHKTSMAMADGVSFLGVDQALSALGLYLRAQGRYVTSRSPSGRGTHTMNRGLFFWVGTRELLPSAWRWFAACVQHRTGTGDDRLLYLGQSTLQRVQRALEVRDAVHLGLNQPQNNDTAEQALSALDVTLLLLMGAVDATARVAHAVLGLASKPYLAGWQRAEFLAEVAAMHAPLADLFKSGTDDEHTHTILRLLRNSIHGEAMQPLAVGTGRHRDRTLIGLPAAHEARLRTAFSALGGLADWGVEELLPRRLHFDAGVLIEQLLPRVITMLNKIMDATPVETLPHVSLQASDLVAPNDGSFVEINRQSIGWQLGL